MNIHNDAQRYDYEHCVRPLLEASSEPIVDIGFADSVA